MCSWFSISAVSRLKWSRSLSSRSSRHRIYCWTSRTTCALRKSSSAILRKPAKSRVTERLCRRAVQTINNHGGHARWLWANNSAIVHVLEPLPDCNRHMSTITCSQNESFVFDIWLTNYSTRCVRMKRLLHLAIAKRNKRKECTVICNLVL